MNPHEGHIDGIRNSLLTNAVASLTYQHAMNIVAKSVFDSGNLFLRLNFPNI